MQGSVDRIISSHVGSLPRPLELLSALARTARGAPLDKALVERSIRECVKRQARIGIDVVTDGEFSKPSFITYVVDRLGGFEPNPAVVQMKPWDNTKEARAFPDFYAGPPHVSSDAMRRSICTGPITYKGHARVEEDVRTLKAALLDVNVTEAFLPSISPSNIADAHTNQYYKSDEEYLFAIAGAMREEYKAIIDAGFILQVDDPNLVTHYCTTPEATIEDTRKWAAVRVEAVNHALAGLPQDRIRFHTCYSINIGPRVHDMQLKDIIDILLRVNADAYSFEFGNPQIGRAHV